MVESLISLLTSVGVQQKVYLDVCVCVWGGGVPNKPPHLCAFSIRFTWGWELRRTNRDGKN